MTVRFVVTEHPPALTAARARHYERIRARLAEIGAGSVETVLYTEVEDFSGASAVVLSGSFAPWSAHDAHALDRLGDAVRSFDGPVLGICAGMQLQAVFAGGTVAPAEVKARTGFGPVEVLEADDLLRGLGARMTVYKHHSDEIVVKPESFRVLARSSESRIEAIADPGRRWWGTQFHPEEFDPAHPDGERVLRNFFELARAT